MVDTCFPSNRWAVGYQHGPPECVTMQIITVIEDECPGAVARSLETSLNVSLVLAQDGLEVKDGKKYLTFNVAD